MTYSTLTKSLITVSLIVIIHSILPAQTKFPNQDWETNKDISKEINSESILIIDSLMAKSKANGALIYKGYLINEWNHAGPSNKKIEVQSITKGITTMILGLALQTGKIKNINDPVINYYPDFNGGTYKDKITFKHLATATSGLPVEQYKNNYLDPGNIEPGSGSHYHNDHTKHLAHALTYIYGESLNNVLKEDITNKIGAKVEWAESKKTVIKNGKTIPVVHGYAFTEWTATDLARVGWLYANNGNWNGVQLLPVDYTKNTQTPIEVPIYEYRKPGEIKVRDPKYTYGLAWRGLRTKSGKILWYMSGNGGQFCIVLPDEGIVFTKINGIGEENKPFIRIEEFEKAILEIIN